VEVILFHLMPYADLDLEVGRKHGTVWVNLPNSNFDPVKGHKLYNRYLDELEYGEELGFDTIAVNEHHQTAYGLMPSPIVTASALARRTKRAKIAILGSALPLREHPLTIAEEHAMIDVISGGRLISGFVRGIGAEYHTFGVNPTFSHDRFHEAHDLIVRAWTEPGPFAFRPALQGAVRESLAWPYQAPADLDPVGGQQGDDRLGGASDRRCTYLQTFSPANVVQRYLPCPRHLQEPRLRSRGPATRLGSPGICRGFGRCRAKRGETALRGVPQRLPQDAPRNAASAGLHLARIAEERVEGQSRDLWRHYP
jgi:hypothetical protein